MQVFVSYVFKPGAKKRARIQLLMPKLLSWSAVSVDKLKVVLSQNVINFSVLKNSIAFFERYPKTYI